MFEIDLNTGFVKITNLEFDPKYGIEDFKNRANKSFHEEEINGFKHVTIDLVWVEESSFICKAIFFPNGKLFSVSLYRRSDKSSYMNERDELEMKKLNDRLLIKLIGSRKKKFSWGSVESTYNQQSCSSSICFNYS